MKTLSMYTLFGSKGAGSAAIEMALESASAPYRIVRASSWEANSARGELAKVISLKQVPTLLTAEGSVLSESAAILIYLGLAHPGCPLLPLLSTARNQVINGLVFLANHCYHSADALKNPLENNARASAEQAQESARAGARRRMYYYWEVFADRFHTSPYLQGQTPGVLDFLTVAVSKAPGTREHLQATRPAFVETLQRIEAHPLVAKVAARHWLN